MQWISHDEAFISLGHTNKSIQLDPIKTALGDGFYHLQEHGITYWSIEGSNVGVFVEEDRILFESYNLKSLYELEYVLNYTSSEIQDTLREYRASLDDVCYVNLNWIIGLNATDLTDLDIDQACSQLSHGGYVDYGHRGSEDDHWLGVASNCMVDERTGEVMCYRCGGGGGGVELDMPRKLDIDITQQTTTTLAPSTTLLAETTTTSPQVGGVEGVISGAIVLVIILLASGVYYSLTRK